MTTSTDIETVKQELKAKAKDVGFGLLNTYDFKCILERKGCPIEKDITVYELCNPAGAQQALTYLSEISVYEDKGVTTLSIIGIGDIVNNLDTDARFQSCMTILFENLKQVMHSWSNQ